MRDGGGMNLRRGCWLRSGRRGGGGGKRDGKRETEEREEMKKEEEEMAEGVNERRGE